MHGNQSSVTSIHNKTMHSNQNNNTSRTNRHQHQQQHYALCLELVDAAGVSMSVDDGGAAADDGAAAMEVPWLDAADVVLDEQLAQALGLQLDDALIDNVGPPSEALLTSLSDRAATMLATWSQAYHLFLNMLQTALHDTTLFYISRIYVSMLNRNLIRS